ncbi:MAG TPA: hypothetical protein PLI21_00845 [Methanomassiliicoccaceae archaeon]|nr:hypothetical protein [Methanomassiliicoccaceae archaeon]
MSEREFRHAPHGDMLHDLAIMVGKKICSERGYYFMDPRPLKDKYMYPGIPDIYVRVNDRTPNGARIVKTWQDWIVEVESNPSAASVLKKKRQFSGDGRTDLIIIDLRKLKGNDGTPGGWRKVLLGDLVDLMMEWIP